MGHRKRSCGIGSPYSITGEIVNKPITLKLSIACHVLPKYWLSQFAIFILKTDTDLGLAPQGLRPERSVNQPKTASQTREGVGPQPWRRLQEDTQQMPEEGHKPYTKKEKNAMLMLEGLEGRDLQRCRMIDKEIGPWKSWMGLRAASVFPGPSALTTIPIIRGLSLALKGCLTMNQKTRKSYGLVD